MSVPADTTEKIALTREEHHVIAIWRVFQTMLRGETKGKKALLPANVHIRLYADGTGAFVLRSTEPDGITVEAEYATCENGDVWPSIPPKRRRRYKAVKPPEAR